jgi:putative membrane protein
MPNEPAAAPVDEAFIRSIERPHANLMKLYFLQALCALFAFPIVIVPLYFRFHTLRYKFDAEGISAQWGILFKREVYLTYKRIQDIHVSRNLFERWLGIGKVMIQTAAGSSSAELTLEGMEHHAAVRDFLYARMRGEPASAATQAPSQAGEDEVVRLLTAIQGELEGARRSLERRV